MNVSNMYQSIYLPNEWRHQVRILRHVSSLGQPGTLVEAQHQSP